jgi:hypothetical protein
VLLGGGVAGVLSLLLMAYCFLDVATSRSAEVRALPKPLWLAVVVLLPVLGPAAWLLAGRPKPGTPRAVPRILPTETGPGAAPDDDEAFLRSLRQRAEEQRRRAEEQRRRDEGERPA